MTKPIPLPAPRGELHLRADDKSIRKLLKHITGVTLNGELVRYCDEADEKMGWLRRLALGADGLPFLLRRDHELQFATVEERGEVRFVFDWDPQPEAAEA